MFWNKKKKLPISEEDKIWIDEDLNWIKTKPLWTASPQVS